MNNCKVPSWKLGYPRHEEEEEEDSHVHTHQIPSNIVVSTSKYETTELKRENELAAMQDFDDTLEAIVHQATSLKEQQQDPTDANGSSMIASRKCSGDDMQMAPAVLVEKKRPRSESEQRGRCFCSDDSVVRDHAAMMRSWPSSESLRRVKTKITDDYYCAFDDGSENGNENEEDEARRENVGARRCRDKINQKMKALQKLVPNANKTDEVLMLDDAIEYLKQLQEQAQAQMVMAVRSNMSQMMMPLGMQQLQMSRYLNCMRMGMGVGLGMGMGAMFDMNNLAQNATHHPFPSLVHPTLMTSATPSFFPPSLYRVPPANPTCHASQCSNVGATTNNNSLPYNDPNGAFLANMATLFREQENQFQQTTGRSSSHANHFQRL